MTLEKLTQKHQKAQEAYHAEVSQRSDLDGELARLQGQINEATIAADPKLVDLKQNQKKLQVQRIASSRRVVHARIAEREALLALSQFQQAGFEARLAEAHVAIAAAEAQRNLVLDTAPPATNHIQMEIHTLRRNDLPQIEAEMQRLVKTL